jgi:hypothetical protein
MTNETLAQGLELWLMIEDKNLFEAQKEYFEEIVWRLMMSNVEREDV